MSEMCIRWQIGCQEKCSQQQGEPPAYTLSASQPECRGNWVDSGTVKAAAGMQLRVPAQHALDHSACFSSGTSRSDASAKSLAEEESRTARYVVEEAGSGRQCLLCHLLKAQACPPASQG